MSLGSRFIFVAAAAVAAAMGDLLMLYVVANAQISAGIVRPPGVTLAVGAMLGVSGIAFYWYGYWLLAQVIAPTRPTAARVVVVCGALIGSIGTVIHAVTAFAIRFDMIAGHPPLPAIQWVARGGTALTACWIIVAGAAVVAGGVFLAAGLSRNPPIPRVLGLLNPVVITVGLVAMGMGTAMGEAFVVPAAPNIAHVLFFFLAAATADSFALNDAL